MSDISKIIGERIRNHRNRLDLSQDELAERAGLHGTYIGQLERGEKNATLESIAKVVSGLGIKFETLFENINAGEIKPNIASQCYRLVDSLTEKEQLAVLELIRKTIEYKNL